MLPPAGLAMDYSESLTSQGIGYIFIPAETRDYVMLAAAIQGVSVSSGPDNGVK